MHCFQANFSLIPQSLKSSLRGLEAWALLLNKLWRRARHAPSRYAITDRSRSNLSLLFVRPFRISYGVTSPWCFEPRVRYSASSNWFSILLWVFLFYSFSHREEIFLSLLQGGGNTYFAGVVFAAVLKVKGRLLFYSQSLSVIQQFCKKWADILLGL